jgi:hypothetical protein
MENGPTGREWGNLTREVEEIRHDLRNLKMITDAYAENVRDIEVKLGSLNAKIYTTVSVAAAFVGLFGIVVNVIISLR